MTTHLDDERLSAYLDGDEPAAAAHLGSCDDCRARLDAFRAVAEAVAAPIPPVDAASRDAAIAGALAAASNSNTTGDSHGNVVPLRRPARRPFAFGAAALVLVVMVAVSVLSRDDDAHNRSLASGESGQVTAGGAVTGASDGGDLGDQSDPTALAARLRAVLEPPAAGGAPADGSGGAAASNAPAAAEARPEAFAAGSKAGLAESVRDADCTATVAKEYGNGLGPLAYRADVRWEGTAAVVLVYPIVGATGGLDRRVLVMARSDCRLLVAQTI